jgi:cellulose synthase/poly-beta-1,6-N-acetylglucosamine synthase-like glycosyltransferase
MPKTPLKFSANLYSDVMVILIFLVSAAVFLAVYGGYFFYVGQHAKKPWNITVDKSFQPEISILVPAHNEEEVIEKKLTNLSEVTYPKTKMEILVIDDASEDKTLSIVENFIASHPDLNIKIVKQFPRAGKSAGLNLALAASTNPIVIVSDADTFWASDVLEIALPYLADPKVGAISGRGINENTEHSWTTKSEETYLNFTNVIRVGESKRHSTIRFEGGFCAYRKGTFTEFDRETGSDDSGTALDVVQHNYRTLLVPEVLFTTYFPTELSGKLKIKARRATQLIGLWAKCLKLMFKGKLNIPISIAIPEFMLFIFNPVVFAVLLAATVGIFILYPISYLSLVILLALVGGLVFARKLFLEVILDNFILLYALASFLSGRRYVSWQKTKIESQ